MTRRERAIRFQRLRELGCVVCWREFGVYTEPEIHHLKGHPWSGMGKRADDSHSIPLCAVHHRHGSGSHIGYHQSPAQFEARYGSQGDLLEVVEGWL